MKKTFATFCLVGGALTLSACDTTDHGNRDLEPPYALERTATHDKGHVAAATSSRPHRAAHTRTAPADRVFQRAQTK